MNNMNDANWLGRTPRTLSESKWGTAADWGGSWDHKSRPTFTDICAIAFGGAVILGFLYLGPIFFGVPA